MADWRQIQARIRKAKASGDPPGQLAQLYERTRDAMVAFELARLHEKSTQNEEAARWYSVAAERFRRAEWKRKAEEALTRLGASVIRPTAVEVVAVAEPAGDFRGPSLEQAAAPVAPAAETTEAATAEPGRPHRRRRGRRGGRRHRRGQQVQAQPVSKASSAGPVRPQIVEEPVEPPPELVFRSSSGEALAQEPAAGLPAWQVRARTGEPALASRLAQLESQLRRLIVSPLHRLDEANEAPAGPGVFILSDSDQSTYYYVEDCQTLRIGVANLLRGERGKGRRGGDSLRARFAEHLGISEPRVSKYLKDHCAVRWLQLDDGAAPLAHFAIAVLRPVLND